LSRGYALPRLVLYFLRRCRLCREECRNSSENWVETPSL
jgi:hypothetical protein